MLCASTIIRGASTIIRGAFSIIRGASNIIRGASNIIRGASNIIRSSSNIIRGLSNIIRGAFSIIRCVCGVIRGSSNIIRGVSNILRGSSNIIRGVSNIIRGSSNIIRGVSNIIRGAFSIIRGLSNITRGALTIIRCVCGVIRRILSTCCAFTIIRGGLIIIILSEPVLLVSVSDSIRSIRRVRNLCKAVSYHADAKFTCLALSLPLSVKSLKFSGVFNLFLLNMEQILQSLNLGTLLGRFREQRMEPQTVLAASDQELVRLGVSTIGDRVRLRDACKKKVEENYASTSQAAAVCEKRLSIFNPRRHNSRSLARATARSSSSTGANKRTAKGSAWTPTFVCMADSTASKTPTSLEKEIIFKAGLGLKKIKLDIQDDEQTVVNKITSEEKDATGMPLKW